MPIYRPSELNRYLKELGASPKKRLSQNFLIDKNIIDKIVKVSDVTAQDTVLEIGPGPGALTEALLKTGAHVVAVEKDAQLAKGLERLNDENLEIVNQDILKFPLERIAKNKIKVIANLPYHLTTPIISSLITQHQQISDIIVMVQEEVAKRFTSSSGTKLYGSITVFLNFYSTPEYGFKVSSNCFFPKPKVNSAVVKFTLHPPPKGVSEEHFFALTRQAFGNRRKMLSSTLSKAYPNHSIKNILQELHLSAQARPEELSLEHFLKLYQKLVD